jgi:integrase
MVSCLLGGLRRAELCGLNVEDVDFENHTVSIRRNRLYNSDDGLYEDTTKTVKSERTIAIPEGVTNEIQKMLEYQKKQADYLGEYWENSPALFKNPDGSTMIPQSIYRWLIRFEEKNNLKHLPLHGLRHTHTSMLLETNKMSIADISARLGHSQKTTTLNIYSHLFKNSVDSEAAENLQNNYFDKK